MTTGAQRPAAGTLSARLRDVVAEELDAPALEVRGLRQLTGGASRETWYFEAVVPDAEPRRLVLRRDPPGSPREDGISAEAHAMACASRAGVPEPEILAYD